MTEVYFSKTWSILGYHDTLKPQFLQEDYCLFKLQFSDLIIRHYYIRKDIMTSFTQEL